MTLIWNDTTEKRLEYVQKCASNSDAFPWLDREFWDTLTEEQRQCVLRARDITDTLRSAAALKAAKYVKLTISREGYPKRGQGASIIQTIYAWFHNETSPSGSQNLPGVSYNDTPETRSIMEKLKATFSK